MPTLRAVNNRLNVGNYSIFKYLLWSGLIGAL